MLLKCHSEYFRNKIGSENMIEDFNLLFYRIVDCNTGSMVKAKYMRLVIT